MLRCVATGEVTDRVLKGKEGRPDRRIRSQMCLFEQGLERRKFRLELHETEAPLPEGEYFNLVPEFTVNDYGDLGISRRRTIQRVAKTATKV